MQPACTAHRDEDAKRHHKDRESMLADQCVSPLDVPQRNAAAVVCTRTLPGQKRPLKMARMSHSMQHCYLGTAQALLPH